MSQIERQLVREIYSEVLFELAEQTGQLDPVIEDLECVKEVLRAEPEFAAILTSEALRGDEKAQIVRRVFGGKISDLALNFLAVLARRGRIGFLSGIFDKYQLLLDVFHHRQLVEVTLPKEPDSRQIDELKRQLADAINSEVKLAVEVDPDILGGIIIKKGDKVIDNSVRAALGRAVGVVIEKAKQKGPLTDQKTDSEKQ